jgi:hypothetical protein
MVNFTFVSNFIGAFPKIQSGPSASTPPVSFMGSLLPNKARHKKQQRQSIKNLTLHFQTSKNALKYKKYIYFSKGLGKG